MVCYTKPNYVLASTHQMSKLKGFCLMFTGFASIHFGCVDTLMNKSLRSILIVLPNNAKKQLYDAKLVAHTNKILLVTKFKIGSDL